MGKNTKGFTLVELSIVIVIIGLIIAGVTAGQSLVKSARLRAQITDLQNYNAAFNAFIMQYNGIPGDISNAQSYFGGTVTNGNGNGTLDCQGVGVDMSSPPAEIFTLFQHLAAARLIPGTYNNTFTLGVGYPALKIDPTKGMIACQSYCNGAGGNCTSGLGAQITPDPVFKAALFLEVSAPSVVGPSFDDSIGILTPLQAYNIDIKIDDGLARHGKFMTFSAWVSSQGLCLTAIDSDSYSITNTSTPCQSEYVLK